MAKIRKYDLERLTGLREILESNGEVDLVNFSQPRRINFDYDFKQQHVADTNGVVSPYTRPHRNIQEMLQYRSAMESVRKNGLEARPELVLTKKAAMEAGLRMRGGEAVSMTRMFLRGLLQGRFSAACTRSFKERAAVLRGIWQDHPHLQLKYPKKWQKADLQNASTKGKWVPGAYLPTPELESLVDALCAAFGADPVEVKRLIFEPESNSEYSDRLVEQVALALLFAAGRGCDIFVRLKEQQLLPGLKALQDTFPAVTSVLLERLAPERFVPGALPASDRSRVTELFYRLGVPKRFCEACALVIAPKGPAREGRGWNPSERNCIESFVQALFQPSLPIKRPKVEQVIERLFPFDVTRSRLYALRKHRFHRNVIKDTRENRYLIKRLARALGYNDQPFLALLLAPEPYPTRKEGT